MIDREHALPTKRQAQLLDLSRSAVYYRPRPVRADTLALMRRIDENLSQNHLLRSFAVNFMHASFNRRAVGTDSGTFS